MDSKNNNEVNQANAWLLVVTVLLTSACAPSRTINVEPTPPVIAAAEQVVPSEPVAPTPAAAPLSTLAEARTLRQTGQLDAYETGLEQLSGSSDAAVRRQALALLGLFLFDEKRWDEAIGPLTAAASDSPATAPFLRLRVMEAEALRGNLQNAIVTARKIMTDSPATSAAVVARLRLPALYSQAGDPTGTDQAFAQLGAVSIDEMSEKDFVDVAAVLTKGGRTDLAARLRMRLLQDYTGGRFTERVYDELAGQPDSPLHTLTLDESVNLASALARANRYDQALDFLKRTSSRFPDAGTNDLYRRVRIRALFNSRNYEQLLAETEGVKLDDASLDLLRARAAWRSNRPADFLAGLDKVEKQWPKTPQAIEARLQRAKYYVTDEVDYAKSISNLTRAIEAGALGNEAENLWTLGWTYTLWQKDAEALRVFDRYIKSYPDGDYKTNSLFWSGKIYDRQGKTAERDAKLRQLTVEYPYSYYAYRAREIMGVPTAVSSEIGGGAIFPNIEEQLAQVTGTRIQSVRELLAIDLTQDAMREMKALAAEYPDNSGVAFMLADVYVAGGEPFKANGILQKRFRQFVRHGGANVPARFWQILFPLNYWDAIRTEAARRQLDPYLVASIIRQESGFEPTVVSNAGAVGLMQIMPAEAPRIASVAGLEGITRERLFDPRENIAVGAAEYSQKLALMSGNHTHAIAAYNAGEGPVGNWIAAIPSGDPDLFVDSIPYAETKLYVKSVTRNRFEYRRIYETPVQ